MDKIIPREMICLDLNEAKKESLKRSEEVKEIGSFINGKNKDSKESKSYIKNRDIIDNNAIDWSQF